MQLAILALKFLLLAKIGLKRQCQWIIVQPNLFGLLHGGISVALAETIGSLAGYLAIEENKIAVGLDINAHHLRSVKQGIVTAKATPISLNRNIHSMAN